MQSAITNQKGMALGVALFTCIILGMVTIYVLEIGQSKRKIQENTTFIVSAENLKNKLMNALNSKTSWALTTSRNNIYNLAGRTIVTPIKINVYDAETNSILFHATNPTMGFDAQGMRCDNFSATQGHDKCFFRYEVAVKSVTDSGGQYVVVVQADLLFKPKNLKYVFNSKKDKFSFDYTVGVDLSAAESICTSIGGVFNSTNNTCTQMLTTSVSCYEPNQSYLGPTTGRLTSSCGVTQLTPEVCPSGQYLYGYDPNEHRALCRNF
jgi:hypothetical protein